MMFLFDQMPIRHSFIYSFIISLKRESPLCGNDSYLDIIVVSACCNCLVIASSISAPSFYIFGCSLFCAVCFLILLLAFLILDRLLFTYSLFRNAFGFYRGSTITISLEDLRVHWYHLFVSIRYHNFLHFAICNVVQTTQNELV